MAIVTQHTTAAELLGMPRDGFRYELVRGILKKMSPAGHRHGRVAMNIGGPLDHHVRMSRLGVVYAAETGFKIASDPDTVRVPDVAFLALDHLEKIGEIEGFLPAAPDLVVEVISPNDSYAEVEEEVFDWLGAGARKAIVANPLKKTLTVFRSRTDIKVLTETDTLIGEDVVPGWALPVKGIFD